MVLKKYNVLKSTKQMNTNASNNTIISKRKWSMKHIFKDICTSFALCSRNKSFACVEVVRKKDERRKMKGHYCKECENVSHYTTKYIS